MKLKQLVFTMVFALLASFVYAGAQNSVPVEIIDNGDGSGAAFGDMWTARTSKNDIDLIGCGIRTFDDGVFVFETGFCQAVMDDGTEFGLRGSCFTESSVLLDAMKATGDMSFITFAWNTDGECTRIGFSTQSFYLPNFTTKGSN